MAFLPDGRLLVTEKRGALKLYSIESKRTGDVTGVPAVEYGGQGGFGDVVLHPELRDERPRLLELRRARRARHGGRRRRAGAARA